MNIVIRASLVVAAVLSGCGGTTASDNAGGFANAGGAQQMGGGAGGSVPGQGGSGGSVPSQGGSSAAAGAGGSGATGGAAGSGGAAGAGGSGAVAGAGGSSSAAGAAGSYLEPDGGKCSTQRVTFQAKPASGQTWCGGCSRVGLSIRPVGGDPLSWQAPCLGCMDAGCPLAPLGPDWQGLTWDGTYYVYLPCDASWKSCPEQRCAPPGKYVVTWGVYRAAGDAGGAGACAYGYAQSVTHEVTFDWPATTTVSWVIGEAADGGDGG